MIPALTRAKLSALGRQADDAAALAAVTLASIKSAEERLGRTLDALGAADSEARAEALKADVSALGTEIERLRVLLGERQAQRDLNQSLVTRLGSWLERLPPNVALEVIARPEREPRDESARAAVERYRTVIAGLRGQMDATRKAPLTQPEVKQHVLAWLDTHAKRGRPHLRVENDRVDVLFENARALVPGDRYAAPVSADFLVWMFRDELAAALGREVDALKSDGALTRDERAEKLAALRAALLDVERAEEAAIMRAGEEGTQIARRSDADPRAVLEVRFVGAAASLAA